MKINQRVIPAITNHKNLRYFLTLPLEYGVLINFQLAQLEELVTMMKTHNKKVIIHLDLIRGLSSDEYGAIYLIQKLKVDGIISSKARVIELCKKRGVISIFRFFLKDSISLEHSIALAKKAEPDYVEILPATMIEMIDTLKKEMGQSLIFSGLIDTKAKAARCIALGASSITSSNSDFWDL